MVHIHMHLLHFTLHRKVYFLTSWVCVLRTWLTHSATRSMTNMEFLELVMPDHMVKVTTIVLSDTHITYYLMQDATHVV